MPYGLIRIGMLIRSIEWALFLHTPLGDSGILFYVSAQPIFHSYHMQEFFVLKVGGGIGIRGRWAMGFLVQYG
jgi:hypothetical protein